MRELGPQEGFTPAISIGFLFGMGYANSDAMRISSRSTTNAVLAFTLIELLIVIAFLAILLAMVGGGPSRKAKSKAQQINCVNNLKAAGVSFRLWAGDNGGKYPISATFTNENWFQQTALTNGTGAPYMYQVFQVMSNELGTPRMLVCPADRDRTYATNLGGHFTALGNIAVSYFVGKDADEKNPQQFLAGDRNIGIKPTNGWSGNDPDGGVTGFSPNSGKVGSYRSLTNYVNDPRLQWTDKLHQSKGNVALADGSVQQFTSSKMRAGITNAGDAAWTYFP